MHWHLKTNSLTICRSDFSEKMVVRNNFFTNKYKYTFLNDQYQFKTCKKIITIIFSYEMRN